MYELEVYELEVYELEAYELEAYGPELYGQTEPNSELIAPVTGLVILGPVIVRDANPAQISKSRGSLADCPLFQRDDMMSSNDVAADLKAS